ncbi:UNVERIFIED_CONTAM: hypothetical protein RMT77_016821 [Armadillidium vulgare]
MAFFRQKFIQKLLSLPDSNFKLRLGLLRPYSSKKESLPLIKILNAEDYNPYSEEFEEILNFYKDKRIIYNCVVDKYKPKLPSYKEKEIFEKIKKRKSIESYNYSIPLIVEKLKNKENVSSNYQSNETNTNFENENFYYNKNEQFPFSKYENMNLRDIKKERALDIKKGNATKDTEESYKNDSSSVREDIEMRLKTYNENMDKVSEFPQMSLPDEELSYKVYKDTLLTDLGSSEKVKNEDGGSYFGTPNPEMPKSSVPCGGCGSYLHCQDEGLPGYMPYEEFTGKSNRELRSMLCQRCYFLREHKAALNVRISPDIYEEALKPIADSHALVIVVVDLFDIPCSVWPEIHNLIGNKRPVVVVGNKVDLLPIDNVQYLRTIRNSLIHSIRETSLGKTNLTHVCVISAKTGFGVEDLISNVQVKWGVKGDIYILGCTNAGKSTLFNAFLGSDMCKVQASSLIRRATASPWPGTTLNLLKFPLMRPSGHKLFSRKQRLEKEKEKRNPTVLPRTRRDEGKKTLTLSGHVGQTFSINPLLDSKTPDPFDINPFVIPKLPKESIGIHEKDKEYRDSKWCFDTPGTVQPDQFLGLLTHEELLDVLPRKTIQPRSFSLRNSQSLFLGGLVRLDLLYSSSLPVRMTVCCSSNIPVTIVRTSDASDIYRSLIGSSLFSVPRGSDERLKKWPCLKPTNVRIKGMADRSSADIVLSSAGFICVTSEANEDIDFRAWTPGGRGVHVRTVPMLPFANKFIGKRMKKSPMYHSREAVTVHYS